MEKKLYWHTTFGKIEVTEQIFHFLRKLLRPFKESANITTRGCSRLLQRIITDFGADNAFGQVSHKLREHYGIEMPESTIRQITLSHAKQIESEAERCLQEQSYKKAVKTKGCAVQVGEIDGCMLPIRENDEKAKDKRKGKTHCWKEARLGLVRKQSSVTPRFVADFGGSVDDAGKMLLNCAISTDFGAQTHLHAVGDGAPWIAEQIDDKFGTQASYLIDFYHVCEYLAEAAKICAPNKTKKWMDTQKKLLKNNDYQIVIENLEFCLKSNKIKGNKATVRACHRYLSNRINHLDYKNALEKGLPIGSGEIESAHRYVIQKRLKSPGAWWNTENVKPMLALRVLRANGEWDDYWGHLSEVA